MKSLGSLAVFELDPGPYALLADLHGNLEALTEVERWLDDHRVTQAVVLGDVIGYGASPAEVVARIRRRGWPVLRGNHEEMFLDTPDLLRHASGRAALKERARRAIDWSREQLNGDVGSYLSSLPSAARIGSDVLAVHGSLVDPSHCHAYIYELSLDLNVRRLNLLAPPAGTLVVYGHTHWPKVFRVDGEEWRELVLVSNVAELGADAYHFVNPGSVGYPRDGDPRASFMVWDSGTRLLEHVRLHYDIEAAAQRIRAAGYHDEIATRLLEAR